MISYFKKSLQEWRERFEDHSFLRHSPLIFLALVFTITTIFMFPSSQALQFANLEKGDVYTNREIIAPFTFYINKNENEIAQDRKLATEEVPLVFNRVDSIEQVALKRFDGFYQELQSIHETSAQDSAKIQTIRDILDDNSILIDQPRTLLNSDFSSDGTNVSNSTKIKRENFNYLIQTLRRIIQDTYAIGILNLPEEDIPSYISKLSVVTTDIETIQEYSNYSNFGNYQDSILEDLRQTFPDHNAAVKIGYPIVTAFVKPNLIFDQNETDQRINDAVSNVPLSKGIVLENERIVNTHEIITEEILEKLNSLALTKAEKEAREGSGFRLVLPYIGKILIVSLSLSFLAMFLMISRKEIFNNFKKMFMIFVIFMFIIAATFLINQFDSVTGLKYLIPIAIASMLLTIFFDTRIAFIGTVTLSIIIGAVRGNDFGLMVILLFIGTIATFAVREIQSRSWILRGMLILSAGHIISIATIEFLKHGQLQEIWEFWLFGLINGVLSPIFAYGIMIIFEYFFNVTTYSTLLELSDLNKPLLRQLAIRAPGTYHHSIMVGNLSEAACEAIGANALLARVASYYHDIGKMEKPDYFVENQKGGKNPHDNLSPNMSCLILISHVKKGLEIAEQYNLPQEICDFIPQHHGTNLIQYFYQKAIESKPDDQINEANYRYHGPKPQTRETGIVMLSDAIEAGSRSLKDPSVNRIRNMVDSFVHERLVDSELDECPLTLRDLNLIKDSYVNNLIGMFHGRIEYPKREKTIFRKNNKRSKKKTLEPAHSNT